MKTGEFNKGLRNGVAAADIVPIFAFDPENGQGVSAMLDIIRKFAPSPLRHTPYLYVDASGGEDYALPETDGPVTALVFKTLSDPFVGKISIMKIITGTLKAGMELVNTRSGKAEKINKLVFLRGRTQIDTPEANAGDIVAVPKLAYTETGDTLCDKSKSRTYVSFNSPAPTLFTAIAPAKKGEEEKMERVWPG